MVEEAKKRAAAIAAVLACIRSEEDAVLAGCIPPGAMKPEPPAVSASPWGVSGRSDLMQQRSMMQLKVFHGYRSR